MHILRYMRLKCARFGFVWYLLFFKVLLIYKFVTFKGFNYNKNILKDSITIKTSLTCLNDPKKKESQSTFTRLKPSRWHERQTF